MANSATRAAELSRWNEDEDDDDDGMLFIIAFVGLWVETPRMNE
jgi:hypothetical protein